MSAKASGRVWDLDLPHNKRLVLLAMADHADHEGQNIYPSTDLIAWKTGYSFRQVQRVIDALIVDGILVVMKPARQQKPATYALDFKAGTLKPPFDRVARKAQSRQNGTPESRQNVTPAQSRDDISTHPGMTFRASRDDIAMSSEPTEPIMNHVVGVGDRARATLFTELRRRKISRAKAEQICATPARDSDILASIDNLYDPANPKTMGGVINLLIDAPPPEGYPYERPSRSVQPIVSPDNPRRSAAKGIHNGTGGSDLKDPGWRQRLIEQAERGELP